MDDKKTLAKIPDRDNFILPEEDRILNKTLSIRERIVDKMTENGIPYKTSEIRVLNEVLNAMDSQIFGKIDRRQKQEDNNNNEKYLEMIRAIVLETEKMQNEIKTEAIEEPVVDIELSDDEIVPGEDKIEYEELDPKDFM